MFQVNTVFQVNSISEQLCSKLTAVFQVNSISEQLCSKWTAVFQVSSISEQLCYKWTAVFQVNSINVDSFLSACIWLLFNKNDNTYKYIQKVKFE